MGTDHPIVRMMRRVKVFLLVALFAAFVGAWLVGVASLVYEAVVFSYASAEPAGDETVSWRNGSQVRYVTERQAAWRRRFASGRETAVPVALLSALSFAAITGRTSLFTGDGKLDDEDRQRA